MIWRGETPYPGVRVAMQRIKDGLMAAHDAILEARVASTHQANKHRRTAPFKEGDLVYLSTKNIAIPKGHSRKLTPRYIGPYKIEQEIVKGATYKIALPTELRARGIHPVFHASLLRKHIALDDRRFPGRTFEQVTLLGEDTDEWQVEKIISHQGRGPESEFQILWKSGDKTWEPYSNIKHLSAMEDYLEALGIDKVGELPYGEGTGAGTEEQRQNGHEAGAQTRCSAARIVTGDAYNPGKSAKRAPEHLTIPTMSNNQLSLDLFSTRELTECQSYLDAIINNTTQGLTQPPTFHIWMKLRD
jgi:hypothetical protein